MPLYLTMYARSETDDPMVGDRGSYRVTASSYGTRYTSWGGEAYHPTHSSTHSSLPTRDQIKSQPLSFIHGAREHVMMCNNNSHPDFAPVSYRAVRWLDRKSFAFQWLTFAISWWVLQVRFCWRPLKYTLRDVLFLGDALSGAAPPRHRRRQS